MHIPLSHRHISVTHVHCSTLSSVFHPAQSFPSPMSAQFIVHGSSFCLWAVLTKTVAFLYLSKKQENLTSCGHTGWQHQIWYVAFQLHHEMQILLSHRYISVTNCALIGEGKLCAGWNTEESVEQCTRVAVSIPVNFWQHIFEWLATGLQIQAFLHVILHCWPLHIKIWWQFLC